MGEGIRRDALAICFLAALRPGRDRVPGPLHRDGLLDVPRGNDVGQVEQGRRGPARGLFVPRGRVLFHGPCPAVRFGYLPPPDRGAPSGRQLFRKAPEQGGGADRPRRPVPLLPDAVHGAAAARPAHPLEAEKDHRTGPRHRQGEDGRPGGLGRGEAVKGHRDRPGPRSRLSPDRGFPARLRFGPPPRDLLEAPAADGNGADEESLQRNAVTLLEKLSEYGIEGNITEIRTGPLVTTYEFRPAPGVKANRVVAMAGDLALAMRCESVRVVPNIPGKGVMGFEIPNEKRAFISLRELLGCKAYAESEAMLSLVVGKDIFGEPVIRDLSKMPHLLIAGATGSGKSVALHSLILSILFRATPEDVRFILVDPKMLELTLYDGIPHLFHAVVTQPREAAQVLKWAVGERREMYEEMRENLFVLIDASIQLVDRRSRSILRVKARNGEAEEMTRLPYIVIVI